MAHTGAGAPATSTATSTFFGATVAGGASKRAASLGCCARASTTVTLDEDPTAAVREGTASLFGATVAGASKRVASLGCRARASTTVTLEEDPAAAVREDAASLGVYAAPLKASALIPAAGVSTVAASRPTATADCTAPGRVASLGCCAEASTMVALEEDLAVRKMTATLSIDAVPHNTTPAPATGTFFFGATAAGASKRAASAGPANLAGGLVDPIRLVDRTRQRGGTWRLPSESTCTCTAPDCLV